MEMYVSEGVSSAYDNGQVMWQEYNGGTSLEKGTAIDIKISGGQTSTITREIPFDWAENEVFYMTITISDDNGTRNVVSNMQCHKRDGYYTLTVEGKGKGTITVVFDKKVVIDHEPIDFSES